MKTGFALALQGTPTGVAIRRQAESNPF